MKQINSVVSASHYPVLDGLSNAGFAGKRLAGIIGVSPPTLSKWRNGRTLMPGSQLVFLTLLLAHLLDEIEAMEERIGNLPANRSEEGVYGDLLATLRGSLYEQEIRNLALAPMIVHVGARLYRSWLEDTGGTALISIANLSDNMIRRPNYATMAAQ